MYDQDFFFFFDLPVDIFLKNSCKPENKKEVAQGIKNNRDYKKMLFINNRHRQTLSEKACQTFVLQPFLN